MALLVGLLGYWNLNEVSGNRSAQAGGVTLVDNNTVGSAAGIIDLGADFERSNSEFLSAANVSADLTIGVTVNLWLKIESNTGSDYWGLFTVGENTSLPYVRFYIGPNNHMAAYIRTAGGGTSSHDPGSSTLSTATFYMLTLTYSNGNGLHVFINASDEGDPGSAAGNIGSLDGSSDTLHVGDDVSTSGRYTDGIIDEVGWWLRELSGAEITELYNGGAGLTYPFSAGGGRIFKLAGEGGGLVGVAKGLVG